MDIVKLIVPSIQKLMSDFQQPAMFEQLFILLITLLIAFGLAQWINLKFYFLFKQKIKAENKKGEISSLRKAIFPLVSSILLWFEGVLLQQALPTFLLRIMTILLFGVGVIYLFFYIVRRFTRSKSSSQSVAIIERFVMVLIWIWIILSALGIDDTVIHSLKQISFNIANNKVTLYSIISGVICLGLTMIVAMWISSMIESHLVKESRLDANLRVVLVRLSKFALLTIAMFFGLSMVGINITIFGVVFGALFAGIGFGLQKIASNYVSGFIILLDRSLRLGDTVNVNGIQGMVMKISTRYTVIRDLNGRDTLVPNETFISNAVQNQSFNLTRGWITTVVQVAYSTDIEHALVVLKEATKNVDRVLQDPPPYSYLLEFASDGINLKLGFWVSDAAALGVSTVLSNVNRNIWRLFKQENISMPFTQREVRVIGWPDESPFPPEKINLEDNDNNKPTKA